MTDKHKEFFEGLAQDWDLQQPKDRLAHIEKLVKELSPFLNGCTRILNIGSGTGVLQEVLERQHPEAEIVSLDIAFSMLGIHHGRFPSSRLVQGDVHFLPFAARSVDTVLCHNSFPHFKEHPLAIRDMTRTLQAGRFLIILHDISRHKVNAVHASATSKVVRHDMLPDPDRLAGLLADNGLQNIQISEGMDYFWAVGKREA